MDDSSAKDAEMIDEEMRDVALDAWNREFGHERQLTLTVHDPEPITTGKQLGKGGMGTVHRTDLHGVSLALKRCWVRRLTSRQLNEIKVLGRISEKRHRHIVELIGSYTHRRRVGYEVGMLIWPVAHTDMAKLFKDLQRLIAFLHVRDGKDKTNGLNCYMSSLLFIAATDSAPYLPTEQSAWELVHACQRRIQRSVGCIAEAVAHLHLHKIRHKDLKPSQILLSPNGLWLTDFGWSVDMSEMDNSVTSGGEIITSKYHAPERDNRRPCGRAEDIFALGCIYLEMSYAMLRTSGDPTPPWSDPRSGFSFHGKLKDLDLWIQALLRLQCNGTMHWYALVRMMLSRVDKERPTISTVLEHIHTTSHSRFRLVDACCYRTFPKESEEPFLAALPSHEPDIMLHIRQLIEQQVAKADSRISSSSWSRLDLNALRACPD
ncbi:kinase-like domain-containing protein [Alternaria rosae]|uniref:kinase-like domain-containing protein n=1 Tax=Alternaria rosae TaxID=1187941 RepID=UPI001E8ED5DF|nr:kinase-like domain-containing protein [Alternaria rosae]KAH6881642.1 kinase-like domain-containing protein [Alternaria rosae]